MAYNSLSEIWAYYDVKERKRFTAHDILVAINQLPQGNPEEKLCRYEALAFGFVGCDRENAWGTYYGHQFTFVRKDTGEEVYEPDISYVTPEIIDYWERRASEVVNPLLKMRYTGLVLDFKKRITGVQPDYKTIKLANIEAIIDVVEGNYAEHDMICQDYAEWALKLAKGFRNESLKRRVIRAYYDFHKRLIAKGDKSGNSFQILQSLIKYREEFLEYENEIIKENEERLSEVEVKALAEGNHTDKYVHELDYIVGLLCDYYHIIGNKERIENLLDRQLTASKLPIQVRGGMWGQMMLERMQKLYRKYGFDKKANRLFVDISDLGEKVLQEMNKTEHSLSLKHQQINDYLKEMMKGNHDDRIVRYIVEYIPVREHEMMKYQKYAKEHPLDDMIPTTLIDSSGNMTTKIGAGKNPLEQKLHHHMFQDLIYNTFFMHIHMDELKKKKDVTAEELMGMFENSPLVTESHKEFLRRGFDAYLNKDYMVCCHILIPQFEAMVRRLIALNGGEVLKQSGDPAAGNEYCSLDSLLGSEVAKVCMKEDMITYFKVLFVSQAGWNLRNLFCHGLLTADSFNSTMADRVIHAIMILGRFRPRPII